MRLLLSDFASLVGRRVHDQMPELMRGIKARSIPKTFVSTQNNDRPVVVGHAECVNLLQVGLNASGNNAVSLDTSNDVGDGAGSKIPLKPYLSSYALDLVSVGVGRHRESGKVQLRQSGH